MKRIQTLSMHLTAGQEASNMETALVSSLSMLEDATLRHDLAALLPGPMDEPGVKKIDCLMEVLRAFRKGQNMVRAVEFAEKYGHDGIASNIVFPIVVTPQSEMPYIDWLVTISNPDDAARIAKTHVLKSKMYGIAFLGAGVLSTRDNESWAEQRKHLMEAFLPQSSLKHIFPVSLARAKLAINERLPQISKNGQIAVEVNEFFLHEAMAQLQLALMGETEEFMNETNIPLRNAFEKILTPVADVQEGMKIRRETRKFIQKHSSDLVKRSVDQKREQYGADTDGTRHVQGPLTARLADLCPAAKNMDAIRRDTAATFFFAGHDTTANLMTWFTFEMARNPKIQARLQEEIDSLFNDLEKEKRDMKYEDFSKTKFLTRCIAETLRLWPSVPNGTLREFERDDTIVGRNGKLVTMPKGTQCVIPVWHLHLNPKLWGPDVGIFNPDRDFLPEEIFLDKGLLTFNPTSHRYAPFTFQPRGCIGQPFANMEARVILAHFFRKYSVTLAEPTLSASPGARDPKTFIAVNNGTMSPVNGIYVNLHHRSTA